MGCNTSKEQISKLVENYTIDEHTDKGKQNDSKDDEGNWIKGLLN